MATRNPAPPTIPLKLSEYVRILKLTRKPTRDEFKMIAKVSGAGLLLIGLIGFIIFFILTEIPQAL
ncbi:MAG: protein translocase SEC61 complex subunit gamma [ANME-2 cluster archaeon]|nr:MAG: protein translocase SEC61 complex subunit gamma [ANME-2 cluster archaeon]HUW67151.1 protein translocase SEC61 complex subunit gamma [Candidatus Nanoarchaeia archaeon]